MFGVQVYAADNSAVELTLMQRLEDRAFPSVFQAWSRADNLPNEPKNVTTARHDLTWNAPQFFGLQWNHNPTGLADGFTAVSIERGRTFRQTLLKLNPHIVLLAEIRYRDAHKSYLPEDYKWWLRDKQGRIMPGWAEGGLLCLDFHNPEFQQQVAKQCKAVVETGVVDGVMLDWWSDDTDRLALIQQVRRAIGDRGLIIANANERPTMNSQVGL